MKSKYTVETVPTPALVIDLAKAKANIERLAAYAKKHNFGIRPHTKTHKSVLMGKLQTKAGAVGLTVAKVGEGEVMAEAHKDLLLAYPALDPARTGRIAKLAKTHIMRVAVDSTVAIDAIAEAARRAKVTVGILADLDVGMHRTGVQTPEEALALAQHAERTKGVRHDGLFTYHGHIGAPDPKEMIKALKGVSQLIQTTLDLWKKHGLEAKIVSGGSTPTAYFCHHIPQFTEIRPGTYIYNDRGLAARGWCAWENCAATIVCTVVSNAVPNKCVLDGGGKTFTYDRSTVTPNDKDYGHIYGYEDAVLCRLSEEHGDVDLAKCAKRPKLGDRVEVVMNHVCPTVNLQDYAWLKQKDGTLEKLPIDARGLLS